MGEGRARDPARQQIKLLAAPDRALLQIVLRLEVLDVPAYEIAVLLLPRPARLDADVLLKCVPGVRIDLHEREMPESGLVQTDGLASRARADLNRRELRLVLQDTVRTVLLSACHAPSFDPFPADASQRPHHRG